MAYIIERNGDRLFEDESFPTLADAAGAFARLIAADRADAFDAEDHHAAAELLTLYDRFVGHGTLSAAPFESTAGACTYTVREG